MLFHKTACTNGGYITNVLMICYKVLWIGLLRGICKDIAIQVRRKEESCNSKIETQKEYEIGSESWVIAVNLIITCA
jgi:hypothetical protein